MGGRSGRGGGGDSGNRRHARYGSVRKVPATDPGPAEADRWARAREHHGQWRDAKRSAIADVVEGRAIAGCAHAGASVPVAGEREFSGGGGHISWMCRAAEPGTGEQGGGF